MYKDGMAINIDEVSSENTTERNGVEVYVQPTEDIDYSKLRNALQDLAFFDNVYINLNFVEPRQEYYSYSYLRFRELKDFVDKFNKKKTLNYNTFRVAGVSIRNEFSILLGNVLYTVDYEHKKDINDDWRNKYSEVALIPKFEIGELSVTPNREDLLYDSKTEKALKKRFDEVNQEISSLIKKEVEGDKDYHVLNTLSNGKLYVFNDCDPDLKDFQNISIDEELMQSIMAEHCTFLGEKLTAKEINKLAYLSDVVYPWFTAHDYDGRIIRSKPRDINASNLVAGNCSYRPTNYLRKDFNTFNWYLKQWARENYPTFTIVEPYSIRRIASKFFMYNDNNGYTKKVKKIYAKYAEQAYNALPAISASVITPEYKAQFSTAGMNVTENINVVYFAGGSRDQQKMTLSKFMENKNILNIYFTEAENLIPTDLCKIPGQFLRQDDDIKQYKEIRFTQVSEKTKKAIAHEENMMYYTELLKPERYWMRFLKTWEIVTKEPWYPKVSGAYQYWKGLSSKAVKFLRIFNEYYIWYSAIKGLGKYLKAFTEKIDTLQEVIDSLTIDEKVINCIDFSKIINKLLDSELAKLFVASIPNVDVDDTIIEQYEKLTKLYSKDDKEHN